MKFDKASALEPLDYDFTHWGVDAKGTVPEPSDDSLGAFLKYFQGAVDEDQETALQAQANALTAAAAKAGENVRIIGEMPEIEGAPTEPAGVAPAVMPERRTMSEIVIGDPEKTRELVYEIAGLCQNQPSGEQIMQLPRRIRRQFIDTVIAMFVNEDPTGGLSARGTRD